MFKKIIYSAMALSITLLPVSEVMATTISTDTTMTSTDSYTLNGTTDTWTGGTITNNGGTLQIVGINQATVATPNYIQNSGALWMYGPTAASTLTIQGTTTTPATITGGLVAVGYNGYTDPDYTISDGYATGNILTLGNYSSIGSGAQIAIAQGSGLVINGTGTSVTMTSADTGEWSGDVTLNNGILTLDSANKITSGYTASKSSYTQTGGTLNLTNGSGLTLWGQSEDSNYMEITGGTVNVGTSSTDTDNVLTVGPEGRIAKDVTVNLNEGNTINLTGVVGSYPSLTLDSGDTWKGTIYTSNNSTDNTRGWLLLDGYSNSVDDTSSIYQQQHAGSGGITLGGTNTSTLYINNEASYMYDGTVQINPGSLMVITESPGESAVEKAGTDLEATLGENVYLNLTNGGELRIQGNGSAVINDTVDDYDDTWEGNVILSECDDNGTLTLRNVTKDFTDENETAMLVQASGTLNIHGNERGGSNIIIDNIYADSGEIKANLNGTVNIQGYDSDNTSSLVINYESPYEDSNLIDVDLMTPNQQINLQGDAILALNTNDNVVTQTANIPTGTGANNNLVKLGDGTLSYGDGVTPIDMGYNVNVLQGVMTVDSPNVKIGIDDEPGVDPYGSLNIGYPGTEEEGYADATAGIYGTTAALTTIVDGLTMNYGGLVLANPAGKMSVGGDFTIGSGTGTYNHIHMMNGGINNINVAGTTVIDDTLDLKIDVDPQKYGTLWQANDKINSANVVQTSNGRLNLSDYKLLSQPTRDHYTFNVVNSAGTYTTVGGEKKTVSGNAARIVHSYIGDYTMLPSSVKGAFEFVLVNHNPQVFRGQVAADVIYANQQVINNQLFDRMLYSILPYFNGRCTNKTASADTLYSPYQYSMTDPGLWFQPYANFETIHMNYGLRKVRNNAYGAMIGADLAKSEWGSWTFIPSVYVGYNGGRTTYNGVGMWHNGGQAGFMGTLTNKNFVTMLNVYGGGYHNAMSVGGAHDKNALWNAGTASKTVYNIHLPGDFILQPTVYMAYNYVDGSNFNSNYDGFHHKVGAMNAYSVAPGLNLIWQKETFSIYALFQAMFNIGSTIAGTVAEVDLPHVGIKDPYFEYGLGASKYFLDRFSGYGQVVARSGSRKGVGFQLGLNLKI